MMQIYETFTSLAYNSIVHGKAMFVQFLYLKNKSAGFSREAFG